MAQPRLLTARRAVARPGPADRAADLRRHQNAQCRGRPDRISRRAECLPCSQARAPRLCHGQWFHHDVGHGTRTAGASGNQVRLISREAGIDVIAAIFLDTGVSLRGRLVWRFRAGHPHSWRWSSDTGGRAIAATWRPWWQVVAYGFVLAGAVRFIHFSLYGGTFLSAHYYFVDAAFCVLFGFLGFRAARTSQMITQYRWLNEPDGPMRWRRKVA